MNERIKEIALQAEGTKKHMPSVWQFYDYELEKFTELLIQECMELVECNGHISGYALSDIIKHHFLSE